MATTQAFSLLSIFLLAVYTNSLCCVWGSTEMQGDDDARFLRQFLNQTLPRGSELLGVDFASSPCNWVVGVVRCDSASKRITQVLFEGMGLTGVIPPNSLGALTQLTHLSLRNNSLLLPIPSDLLALPNLAYLSLSVNNLSGEIPHQILRLPMLARLDLSLNALHGSIPSGIGNLEKLRYVYLGSNLLSGSIPASLFRCANLVDLDLSQNQLSGPLPENISSLQNLRSLNLSMNRLRGNLPSGISEVHHLAALDLTGNLLFGSLSLFQPLKRLNLLWLSDNFFSGSFALTENMRSFKASNNGIRGPLPTLSNSTLLHELDLSRNFFTGSVDLDISKLTSLRWLDLSSNNLSGELPRNLTSLIAIERINLAGNNFDSGSFPVIAGLSNLSSLNLSSVGIYGAIPEVIGDLVNLVELDLSHNRLNGSLPQSMSNLVSLTHLDLSNNLLSGNVTQVASVVSGLPNLAVLNMSSNQWNGCVPATVQRRFGPDSFGGDADCYPLALDANGLEPNSRHHRIHMGLSLILTIAFTSLAAMCALAVAVVICRKRQRDVLTSPAFKQEKHVPGPFSFETDSGTWVANVKDPSSVPVIVYEKPLLNLTFADLLQATADFSQDNQLTEGGFGPVYRAVLPGGMDAAIKVLMEGRGMTDQEAAAEFGVLSKIRHPNVVPLLGYCIAGNEKLVIYEYTENGGLHWWLHEYPAKFNPDDRSRDILQPSQVAVSMYGDALDWTRRHRIALGVARALAFLHHGYSTEIVHRDIKASNVLLDAEFEPHLANTGLAAILAAKDNSSFIPGTPGYIPPEYNQASFRASAKGDVYSFGVLLLELVTGKRSIGDYYQENFSGNLVAWVRMLMKDKRGYRALDPKLLEKGPMVEMLETLRIGYLCTADSPSKRPVMHQIVGLLKDMEPRAMISP